MGIIAISNRNGSQCRWIKNPVVIAPTIAPKRDHIKQIQTALPRRWVGMFPKREPPSSVITTSGKLRSKMYEKSWTQKFVEKIKTNPKVEAAERKTTKITLRGTLNSKTQQTLYSKTLTAPM